MPAEWCVIDEEGEDGYRRTVLENGIRVVSERMPQARSIALGVLCEASPHHETAEQSGLAHLTEHLLFQGTSSRDALQIARLIDLVGGSVGGFTTRDYTCYAATVLDEHCPYALDLLGDLLLNSTFPQDKLENEKHAILREIDSMQDAPEVRINDLLKASVWPDHALGRPIAGSPATVARLTREDVIYFFHRNYEPGSIIVAAAGNLIHEDFAAQVRDSFWRLLPSHRLELSAPPDFRSGVWVEHRPVSQAYFCVGLRASPYTHADRYSLHVLTSLLGGGISSRLFRRFREDQGLVYHIGAEYHAYRDGGLLVVEGSTAPQHLLTVLEGIFVELGRLAVSYGAVDEEELWKAKMQLRSQHHLGSENSQTRMSRLATQELYFGRQMNSGEILREIETVNVARLQRLAVDLLDDSLRQPAVVVVGPGDAEQCSVAAIEQRLRFSCLT
jgi:predicted Zn-dependent peptidase